MKYRAEIWALTSQAKNKLAAAQTKTERSMLNIKMGEKNKHLFFCPGMFNYICD